MLSFWQLLETMVNDDQDVSLDSTLVNILNKLEPKDRVKFALDCAIDAFHFNNDATREAALNCINAVKSWLDSGNTNAAYANDATYYSAVSAAYAVGDAAYDAAAACAAYAAADAALTVVHVTNDVSTTVNAANAYYYDSNNNDTIKEQKTMQYKRHALSFLAKTKNKEKFDKPEIHGIKNDIQQEFPDPYKEKNQIVYQRSQESKLLPILIDILHNDTDHDIIIQNNNKFSLNIAGYKDISADSVTDLALIISNNPLLVKRILSIH